jgi:multidrug resistance efflux pump
MDLSEKPTAQDESPITNDRRDPGMKKMIVFMVIFAVLVFGGGAAVLYYMNEVENYVLVDDAKVQGDLTMISAPATGRITEWKVKEGQYVNKGDLVGRIQTAPAQAGGTPQTVDVIAPQSGTVIQTKANEGAFVSPGMPLAMTADLDHLYVIANVEETKIQDVKQGHDVKITIDAFPDQTFTGKVEQIGFATTSTFSLLPNINAEGNYTKVAQRIPVKISFDNYERDKMVPGLNAEVKIKK